MLKNKKKLRRIERNTPGYAAKAAQSLVLAGALVGALTLGGVGGAMAAATDIGTANTWDAASATANPDGFSLTGASSNQTVTTTGTDMTAAGNVSALTITGTSGNAAQLNVNTGLFVTGALDISGNASNKQGIVLVQGGKTLTAGATTIGNFGMLQLGKDADASNNGTATLASLDVTAGGKLVLGGAGQADNGSGVAGSTGSLTVTGKVTTADAFAIGGTGGEGGTNGAGEVGGQGTLILKNAQDSVFTGKVTVGGTGGASNDNTNLSGAGGAGTLTVQDGAKATFTGGLAIGGVAGDPNSSQGKQGAGGQGTVNLDNGTIVGNVTLDASGVATPAATKAVLVAGAGDGTVTGNVGVTMGTVTVTAGDLNISGNLVLNGSATGAALINVTAGQVLTVGGDVSVANGTLTLGGSGTGTLKLGKDKTLTIHDTANAGNANLATAGSTLSEVWGNISVDKGTLSTANGSLIVKSYDGTGLGKLTTGANSIVKGAAALTVGELALGKDLTVDGTGTATDALHTLNLSKLSGTENLTLNGGTINFKDGSNNPVDATLNQTGTTGLVMGANGGTLTAKDLTLVGFSAADKTLTAASGPVSINAHSLVSDTAIFVGDSASAQGTVGVNILGGTSENSTFLTQNMTIGGHTAATTVTLDSSLGIGHKGGTTDKTVTLNGNSNSTALLNVTKGNWTVGSLDVTQGTATVNGGASLKVTGSTLVKTNGLLTIATGGKVEAQYADFFKADGTVATAMTANSTTVNGVLYLRDGGTFTGIYNEVNAKKFATDLKGAGSGAVSLIGKTFVGAVTGGVSVSAPTQGLEMTTSGVTGNVGANVTLEAKNLTTSNTTTTKVAVASGGVLSLLGDGGAGALINATGKTVALDVELTGATLSLGNDVIGGAQGGTLGNITAAAGNTATVNSQVGNFTVGNVTGDSAVDTVNLLSGNLTTGDLALGADHNVVTAAGGGTLNIKSLTATTGNDSVTVTGATLVSQGNVDLGAGNNAVSVTEGMLDLTGKDLIASTGTNTLSFDKSGGVVKDIKLGTGTNTISLTSSTLIAGDIISTGTDKITVGKDSSLSATNITLAGANDRIAVGTAEGAGSLNVTDNLTLAGATLFIDPSWVNNTPSSVVAVANMGADDKTIDGVVVVGRNSHLTIGVADNGAWLTSTFKDAIAAGNLTEGGVTAAMGIYKPMTLDGTNGSITLDGSIASFDTPNYKDAAGNTVTTATAGNAIFAADSLLVVNANAGLGTNVALTGAGAGKTLTVDAAAKLHISGGKVNDVVKVTAGFNNTTLAGAGWNVDGTNAYNLTTDTLLLKGIGTAAANGVYNVTLQQVHATNVFSKLSHPMGGLVDNVMVQYGIQSDSENAGVRFVSRAVSNNYGLGGHNAERAAATIEGAAQMGAVAGVQISTIGAASVASSAVTTRTSFAQPLMDMTKAVAVNQDADGNLSLDTGLNAGNGMKSGLGVWIMPLYQSNKTWGQKAENFKTGMSSDLGGIALGADYTINDMFRFGAAFNVGGGYGQSSGDFNETENRFNFWGVNLYGGWTMNNFGLSADVGYTSSFNAVEQELPSSMAMGNLKADVTTSAWTAGLKGEYKFETSVIDIIPHVGVRYMGLTTDSYDVKSGGTVFGVERDFQSIWTFPIGVAFSKTIESDSGWMFKPMIDLTIIPAAGDLDAKSKASIPGVGGNAEMKMQVVDAITYDGGVGFEVGKGDLSFGLNYNIQASEHRTGHGVFGTLRYEF